MDKNELIEAVAAETGLSPDKAAHAVDAVVNAITDALKKGQQVSVLGFGTFGVRHRAARSGRNPRTGEVITIAASNVPGFKAGKKLSDAVRAADFSLEFPDFAQVGKADTSLDVMDDADDESNSTDDPGPSMEK